MIYDKYLHTLNPKIVKTLNKGLIHLNTESHSWILQKGLSEFSTNFNSIKPFQEPHP